MVDVGVIFSGIKAAVIVLVLLPMNMAFSVVVAALAVRGAVVFTTNVIAKNIVNIITMDITPDKSLFVFILDTSFMEIVNCLTQLYTYII